MSAFILHSNNTVLPTCIEKAYVLVSDGCIKDIFNEAPGSGIPVYDLGNKFLMPGIIDPHLHINEPGRTEWEGFETATRAAIYGGVCSLVDMPLNASPVTTTAKAFDEKWKAAAGKVHAHCGFWGGIIPGNTKEIEPLVEKGVLGFKAFLTHSGITEFPDVTEADLQLAMPVIARHHLPLLVHCELSDNSIIQEGANARSYKNYLDSRPCKWEDNAIALMVRLCEKYHCPVHIVHLSSAGSITQIMKAKERGLPLSVETAQHYLFFNAEDIPEGKTAFKCAPPIREKENNEQLWEALKSGIIDFVATDHSPSIPELKELSSGDFSKAWGGIASIQFALTALWTAARKRKFTMHDVVKWLCSNPSKLIGCADRKGSIQIGFDADLVVFDPDAVVTATESMIQHKHKISPYVGQELYGRVEQVFLKGEKVFENNQLLQEHRGQMIIRNN